MDALPRLVDPALGARSLGGRWLSVRGSDAHGHAPLVQVIVLMVTLVRALSFGERWLAWWALMLGGRALVRGGSDARGDAHWLGDQRY